MTRTTRLPENAPVAVHLPDEQATGALGGRLWHAWSGALCIVHLQGDLGAGKTTLVRGLLRSAGHTGAVRSPTYTLVEPYTPERARVLHLDLYRLGDPEELELLGLRDELGSPCLVLVEWPERGEGVLPAADVVIALTDADPGRHAVVTPRTATGADLAGRLRAGVAEQSE